MFILSAIPVFGWNVTIYNLTFSSFTLQWTMLNTVSNHSAEFYIVEVKGIEGIILTAETVPGNVTTAVIEGLRPFTKYRVRVFAVDCIGLPYKSLESVTTTKKGKGKYTSKIALYANSPFHIKVMHERIVLKETFIE